MKRTLIATVAAAALLQGGLASAAATPDAQMVLTAAEPRSESAQPTSELDALMAYVLRTRQMSGEQLVAEANELRRLADQGNDIATLKLAMLLSDQGTISETEVMAVLQPLFEDSRATRPELRAFALLISRDVQDRRRMKETLAATQGRLKDAQRNQEASEAKAAQMRRQIDELQNKINAFMMMEQSILKRGR